MAVTSDWADATIPTDAELTRIPKPSDVVVREIAERARSLDGDEDVVSWAIDGLVRPREALLDALLFPPSPVDAAIATESYCEWNFVLYSYAGSIFV